MATVQKKKNLVKLSARPAAIRKRKYEYTCLTLRFADAEHHELVKKAAALAKVPLNAWLIRVTLEAARREVSKA